MLIKLELFLNVIVTQTIQIFTTKTTNGILEYTNGKGPIYRDRAFVSKKYSLELII